MLTSIGLIKAHTAGQIAVVGSKRFLILGNCRDDSGKPSIITSYDRDGRDYYTVELYQCIKFLDIVPDIRKVLERGERPYFFIIPYNRISQVINKKEVAKSFICEKCGKVISSRQKDNNNKYIQLCSDCLKLEYISTDEGYINKRNAIKIGDEYDGIRFISRQKYFSNLANYTKCPICKGIFHVRNSSHACTYHVQAYGLKFSKEVLKKLKPNVRYFGIEHEVFSSLPQEFARAIRGKYGDLFLTKQDGSVAGIEIVSRPVTFEFLESFNWGEYMNICNQYGRNKDGAGIHIHISKGIMTRGDIVLILKFLAYNYNSILKFTRRTEESLNGWALIGDGYEIPKRLFQNEHSKQTWHGCAVNTSNSGTDEFRIFSSTLTQRQFRANYQFVNALIDYIKQLKTLNLSFIEFCKFVKGLEGHSQLKYVIERSI